MQQLLFDFFATIVSPLLHIKLDSRWAIYPGHTYVKYFKECHSPVEGRIDREIVVDLGVATWSKRFSEATSWVTCLASVKALETLTISISN